MFQNKAILQKSDEQIKWKASFSFSICITKISKVLYLSGAIRNQKESGFSGQNEVGNDGFLCRRRNSRKEKTKTSDDDKGRETELN